MQYSNFKDLMNYKDGDISYNPEVPSYSTQYQLTNDDYNVKQLRKDMTYQQITRRSCC